MTSDVLKAWTGWPLLPEESLKVKIGVEFSIQACSYELSLPLTSTSNTLRDNLHAMMTIGTEGFGSMWILEQ
jgi:hypothetical protein